MSYDDPLAEARSRVVFPTRVGSPGGPTRGQAQGPNWRQTSRGFYVPASVDGAVVEQRIAEAAAVLPEVGGVTGWAGLRWAGAVWCSGTAPDGVTSLDVDLATCYQDIRNQAGFRLCQERLPPHEVDLLDGVQMTHPVRSVFFAMRYAESDRQAVEFMDMAAYSDLCSIDEVRAYAEGHPGWTGVPQARCALNLADENSWSPRETSLRLIWVVDAGLSPPLCNRPIFDRQGRHIGTPDILDLESGAVGEYDGALHLTGLRRSTDSKREERFRNHGFEPFHIVGADMADRGRVAERMHAARHRAKWEAESQRSWTIVPPPWWRQTHTVELRRALDLDTRISLLAHRRRVS